MKKIALWLLNVLIKYIVGSHFFNKVDEVVTKVSSKNIPGNKKKEIVIEELKKSGFDFANYAANLAIEAAVTKLKGV